MSPYTGVLLLTCSLQAICQRLVGRLHRVPPGEALSLLWSLAKLRYNKRITASIAASCLARARPQLQQQGGGGGGWPVAITAGDDGVGVRAVEVS